MIDFLNIQSYAAERLRAVFTATGGDIASAQVVEDRGYADTEIANALQNDGFCVVVRFPTAIQSESTNGKSVSTATLLLHLMENPEENQRAAALQLNMQAMVTATCAAIQAADSAGVRCFHVSGVQMAQHDPATLVYEITVTVPTTGF